MKQKDLPGIKEKQHKQVSEWQVESFTSDNTYTVTQDGKKWTCTCPSYMKRKKACKHIQRIREKLGLSKPDASGWKSGIQKGIRRNDLPLLRLCFDRLWQDKTLRRWLLWRLPILAGEEVESYVGLTSRLQGNASRESVWELLARMSVSHKSKEGEGLRVCSHLVIEQKWNPEDFVKGERLRELLAWMDVQKKIDWDGQNKQEFWSWFNVSMNEYAKETLTTCKRRFYTGGMGGDRELMITIAWMCVTRPWPEPEIIDVPKEEDVEPAKGLPWYVWDMHTSIGKIVRLELRKLIEDRMEWRYVSDDLWFNSESAQVDRLFPDSFWWPTMLRMLWKKYGKTEQEAKEDWQVWRPRIKALVEKEIANQHV